jgi:uncharacterized protein (TIGR02646 family)
MKHVRALEVEPPLLGEYRCLPAAGANRPANEATEVWKRFKKRAPDAYRQLISLLANRQQGLCMYCERLLVDPSTAELISDSYLVEHVLGKSGGHGRVLDWTNLALSCWVRYASKDNKTCADAKLHQELPNGCDPRQLPIAPALLEVSSDGLLKPNPQLCESYGADPEALKSTIKLLELNAEPLRVNRQKVRDTLRKQYSELLIALKGRGLEEAVIMQALRAFVASRLEPVNGLLKSFWTTERCELGEIAETWIIDNANLFE